MHIVFDSKNKVLRKLMVGLQCVNSLFDSYVSFIPILVSQKTVQIWTAWLFGRQTYIRALTDLAKESDSLKTAMPNYDDEDIALIKGFCEEWGTNWQNYFNRHLTPKAHSMIFVIPEFIKIHSICFTKWNMPEIQRQIYRKIWAK